MPRVRKQKIPAAEESSEGPRRIPFAENFDGSAMLRLHNEHYVDRLYDSVKDVIAEFKKSENVMGEITSLVVTLMEGVRVYPGVTGKEKKIIVLKVVRRVLGDIEMHPETHIAVQALVNMILPNVIDFIVSAANGEFKFKLTWLEKMACC